MPSPSVKIKDYRIVRALGHKVGHLFIIDHMSSSNVCLSEKGLRRSLCVCGSIEHNRGSACIPLHQPSVTPQTHDCCLELQNNRDAMNQIASAC